MSGTLIKVLVPSLFPSLELSACLPAASSGLPSWYAAECIPRRQLATRHERPRKRAFYFEIWSGRRDLNPRLRPWQGRTLPLSYSRSAASIINKPSGPSNAEPPTKLTSALSFLEPVSKFEIRKPRFSAAGQTCFRSLTRQRTDVVAQPDMWIHLVIRIEIQVIPQTAVAVIR